jgi:hypothetical protein
MLWNQPIVALSGKVAVVRWLAGLVALAVLARLAGSKASKAPITVKAAGTERSGFPRFRRKRRADSSGSPSPWRERWR